MSSASAEVLLHKLTRREFRARMDAGELHACILPVAAIEQHLEHLAMEHDWRSVTLVAHAVAERLQPHVLVAEGLMAGISEHHMRHRGTLSLTPGAFLAVLHDLIRSMVEAGFRHILVLNGHGGNIAPCRGIWGQFLLEFQVDLHFLPYWDVLTSDDRVELLASGAIPRSLPGHAQEFETAIALAQFPENVRENARADQPDPTPALATADVGQQFFERVVDRVTNYLAEMIAGKRAADIPPFHP